MTVTDFRRRIELLNATGQSLRDQAALLVLVHGASPSEAARQSGCDIAHVQRWANTISGISICDHCGGIDRSNKKPRKP